MRFHRDGPSIPDLLLERCDAGRVVFLCGAGVSVPAGLPDFKKLTQQVINFFDPAEDSEIRKTFNEENPPLDKVFHLLYQEFVKSEVDAFVAEQLRKDPSTLITSEKHELIKRISSGQSGYPQIVTTNFDRLFELSSDGNAPKTHKPPALPDVSLGSEIEGITYLHGQLADNDSEHHEYVLSSADFGRAYLSEGWATEFVRNLLKHYTVVLLGYRAEDPPVKYLLQGLNHDSQYDRSRLYAFGRGRAEDIEAEWRDRGVTAIAYNERDDLWQTLEAWAERKDSPRRWLESVIASARHDPKSMEPHERGQVVHALRTARGAKLFASANPVPHPEWICVLDARVRSAEPSKSYGPENEEFDPRAAYGLDDDQETLSDDGLHKIITNDDLLVWREGDDNPAVGHSLVARQATGYEAIPVRLGYLMGWIVSSVGSPVMAWWVARQGGLHSKLLRQLLLNIDRLKSLPPRATHIWNLLLEYHKNLQSIHHGSDWYLLKDRVATEGWSPSVLRFFRDVATPRIEIQMSSGIAKSKPPALTWNDIHLGDIGCFEVTFLERYNETLDVPDEVIPKVIRILEDQFLIAAGLLEDIESFYFASPTLYPNREVDGRPLGEELSDATSFFVYIFDRLSVKQPKLAENLAAQWSEDEAYFFRKFKLYALSKAQVFEAATVTETLLSFSQEAFWDRSASRELLFLLVDRWDDFSIEHRQRLMERILAGPDQESHWTDEVYAKRRSEWAARYGRYLELNGCSLSGEQHNRLMSITKSIPRWDDSWVQGAVGLSCSRSYSVRVDDSPGGLLSAPVDQVIEQALGESRSDDRTVEYRPFRGLIKARPLRAMRVLSLAAQKNDYPTDLWEELITHFPVNVKATLQCGLANIVIRLPDNIIVELRYTLGRWIESNLNAILACNETLGWRLFDRVVDCFLDVGEEAMESALGELRRGGKVVKRSRRTYHYAINSPIGDCTGALISTIPDDAKLPLSDKVTSRIERLMTAPGEGADHAISILMRQFNWFMQVDPAWTSKILTPTLSFDHSLAEPAWASFILDDRRPIDLVLTQIRPLLNGFVQWMNELSWEDDMYAYTVQWLAQIYLFLPERHPNRLSDSEMRNILRHSTDKCRNSFIQWLGRVGQRNENGWVKFVISIIQNAWPLEARFRTSSSAIAWINLLDDCDDNFPMIYGAVKKFLAPVSQGNLWLHRFTRDTGREKCLTRRFPETVLDMMNRITPQVHSLIPAGLPSVLTIIAESNPELLSDVRYLRLIDLVENA